MPIVSASWQDHVGLRLHLTSDNTLVVRNGETGQFTTAADKVTGELVKVDVMLTVIK